MTKRRQSIITTRLLRILTRNQSALRKSRDECQLLDCVLRCAEIGRVAECFIAVKVEGDGAEFDVDILKEVHEAVNRVWNRISRVMGRAWVVMILPTPQPPCRSRCPRTRSTAEPPASSR
jgi:hypothetical protein